MDWINASDLEGWAETREAQGLLPLLVRRLILATAQGVRRVDFPTGEGVQSGGWDGVVEADDGGAFFPSGVSGWELSVQTRPKRKADQDFEKRSNDPLEVVPSESAFVFVTPRRWPGSRDWERARQADGRWAAVRALDADDIDAWLDQAPAVEAWLAAKLGKLPTGVADITDYWSTIAATTQPPLVPALVLESRKEKQTQLAKWLSGEPSLHVLEADSLNEAVAFVSAALEAPPEEEQPSWSSRALLLDDAADWFRWGGPRQGLLLVVRGGEADVAHCLARAGNHVLIVRASGAGESKGGIRLRRLSMHACVTALESMGLPKGTAERLAKDTGRSFAALRYELGAVGRQPAWAGAGNLAPVLVPALLAGAWDEGRDADKNVIASLSGMSYGDFRRNLLAAVGGEDPPLRTAGTVWRLTAPAEAWRRLGSYVTADDLARLRRKVEDVLEIPDPSLELSPSDRWTAGFHGKVPPHSSLLRESLAETLARLAVLGPSVLTNVGYSPEALVSAIVRDLLEGADTTRWASLREVLPTLAEAAPDEFLDTIESALEANPCPLLGLFEEGDSLFFSSSHYTYVLWSLERLTWSRDHLSRAALAQAALAGLDPGGRLANRPKASLREVLLPWTRNTAADLEERLIVVDLIVKTHPDVGFDLLLGLLPRDHDTCTPPARPRFRNWDEGADRPVYRSEHFEFVKGIGERVLAEAIVRADRWADVLGHIDSFGQDFRESIREEILKWAEIKASHEAKKKVWDALRQLVSRHRQFPEADWAFPKDEVEAFEALVAPLSPDNAAEQVRWLFDNPWPELPRKQDFDYEQQQRAIGRAREEAAKKVHDQGGAAAILALARTCGHPELLGQAAAGALPDDLDHALLGPSAGSSDLPEQAFALGYVRRRSDDLGFDWVRRRLSEWQEEGWSPDAVTDFLCGLPPGLEAWSLLEELGGDLRQRYWSRVAVWVVRDPADRSIAIDELLQARRPRAAIHLAWVSKDHEITSDQIARCLEEQLKHVAGREEVPASYELVSLFERLEAAEDLPPEQLAGLEWQYFSVLEESRCKPGSLYAQLNAKPGLFVQLVCSVFLPREANRSKEEAEVAASEKRRELAQQAYRLLENWPGIPGLRDDGTIDVQDLKQWISEAREQLALADRAVVGDQCIGKMLSHAPEGKDGAWPHEVVRGILEDLRNSEVETGIEIGVFNSRGVHARGPGGEEERQLSQKYLGYSQLCIARWPRAAAMLRRIAQDYRGHARREDFRWEADDL